MAEWHFHRRLAFWLHLSAFKCSLNVSSCTSLKWNEDRLYQSLLGRLLLTPCINRLNRLIDSKLNTGSFSAGHATRPWCTQRRYNSSTWSNLKLIGWYWQLRYRHRPQKQIFLLCSTDNWRSPANVSFLPFPIWNNVMLDLSILNAKRAMVFVFQKTIKYRFEFRTELARVTHR